jgi:protein SCO1
MPKGRAMTRIAALLAAAVVITGLAVGGYLVFRGDDGDPYADCRAGAVAGGATIGGPFTLTAADGRSVTEAEAITRPTLVYFGYSFCPDFCPTDLSRNAGAAEILAGRGIDVGRVFITIDPARDTPEAIGPFAQAIDPGLLALTGTPEQVDTAAKVYKVYYRKSGDDPEFYMMDHTTFTYLMAPGPGFLEFYRSEVTSEAVADSVACYAQALAS